MFTCIRNSTRRQSRKWTRLLLKEKSKTEMTASVRENKSKHTRGSKWMPFNVEKTKQCPNFRHTLPLTKQQPDIKHEKESTLSQTSLLNIAVEKLPPSQRSSLEKSNWSFPNSIFAREGSSFSCFICLSVCRFVKGNVCRKYAYCFVLSTLKKRSFYF